MKNINTTDKVSFWLVDLLLNTTNKIGFWLVCLLLNTCLMFVPTNTIGHILYTLSTFCVGVNVGILSFKHLKEKENV